MNLLYNTKITRAMLGQSSMPASTGVAIDMSGFEGVMFILHGSSLMESSTGMRLSAKGCATTAGTWVAYQSGADSTSAPATGSFDKKIYAIDFYKPLKRYIRAVVTDCSSDVGGAFTVTAIQYGARYPGSTNLRDSTYLGAVALAVGATSS